MRKYFLRILVLGEGGQSSPASYDLQLSRICGDDDDSHDGDDGDDDDVSGNDISYQSLHVSSDHV